MTIVASIKKFIHAQGSLRNFYILSGKLLPWFFVIGIVAIIGACFYGLVFAPIHAEQKDSYRIIYIHVPTATLSLMIYIGMAVMAAIWQIWHIKNAEIVMISCVPVGAAMTLIAFVTGFIWGLPTWGDFTSLFWRDPRMVSVLILLFLYLAILGLHGAIEDRRNAADASSILILAGLVLIPFIKWSVNFFNSLHQGQTSFFNKTEMDLRIAIPLVISILGFCFYSAAAIIVRIRLLILQRDRKAQWVKELE